MVTLALTDIVYGSSLASSAVNSIFAEVENYLNGVTASANITLTGTITGGSFVTAGNITVNTDKFTVAGATGNTLIAGTLGVTGLITGTLATAAQTNITSIGALTGLSVTAATAFSTYTSSTGTNRVFSLYSNTGGNMYVGRENSTGNGLVTNGGSAYACVFGTSDNLYPLQFFTQDTVRMTIATAGDATFTKKINTTDTTDSTSGGTGSIYTAGGLGVTKAAFIGTNLGVGIAPDASYLIKAYTTGATEQLYIERFGGTASTRGKTKFQHSNIGYSGGTGADCYVQTDWGYGFSVNHQGTPITALTLRNSGDVIVNNSTASTSTTTGALVVAGGVGVGGNIYVGGDTFRFSADGYVQSVGNLILQCDTGGGSNDYISLNNGAGTPMVKVYDQTNNVELYGDIYTTAWTDYSGTSTVTGWSSFTVKQIYYKKVGKMVYVTFALNGTSNSTSVSFTLPFDGATGAQVRTAFWGNDSGTGVPRMCNNYWGVNNQIDVYSDLNGGSWTNSGGKYVYGQFFYEVA